MVSVISISILTIIFAVGLVWASIAAPCIEIGFFWVSCLSAILVALTAWRLRVRLGQCSVLALYCLLSANIFLATASLTDLADYSMLGRHLDAITAIVLGWVLSFVTVAVIAVRLSSRFPKSLCWWVVASVLSTWLIGLDYLDYIPIDNRIILTFVALTSLSIGFWLLSKCKLDLSSNQYLSMLTIFLVMVLTIDRHSGNVLAISILQNSIICLCCLLFFVEKGGVAPIGRLPAILLFLIGLASLSSDVLNTWLGINEIIAGLPGLILFLLGIMWLCLYRSTIPRILFASGILLFYLFGIFSILPESYSVEKFTNFVLAAMCMYFGLCAWHMLHNGNSPSTSWKEHFKNACSGIGVLAVASGSFAVTFVVSYMLVYNFGPARMLNHLYGTMLWPGNGTYIKTVLNDEYYFRNEVGGNLSDPANNSFESVFANALPDIDIFSYVDETSEDKDFDAGFELSTGVLFKRQADHLTVLNVSARSLAGKSGLSRGDKIIALNGESIRKKSDERKKYSVRNKDKNDSLKLLVASTDGSTREIIAKVERHEVNPAFHRIVTTPTGMKIGYLYMEDFAERQEHQFENIFREFKSAGIDDLVLDLRYNGGGRVTTALGLAGYITGGWLEGKTVGSDVHAWKYHDRDKDFSIPKYNQSLKMSRLVVLTSDYSASASEVIISWLRPYMPVITVGTTTFGKPYFMSPIECGDKTINLVNGIIINSVSETVPTSGIRPDYRVQDDLSRNLGDPQEGMFLRAIDILEKYSTRL